MSSTPTVPSTSPSRHSMLGSGLSARNVVGNSSGGKAAGAPRHAGLSLGVHSHVRANAQRTQADRCMRPMCTTCTIEPTPRVRGVFGGLRSHTASRWSRALRMQVRLSASSQESRISKRAEETFRDPVQACCKTEAITQELTAELEESQRSFLLSSISDSSMNLTMR